MRSVGSLIKTAFLLVPSAIAHSRDVSSFLTLVTIMVRYRVSNRLSSWQIKPSNRRMRLRLRANASTYCVQIRNNRGDIHGIVDILLGNEYSDIPSNVKIESILDLG